MQSAPAFRVGFVPGVTLAKWSRVWAERHPERPLEAVVVDQQEPTGPLHDTVDVVFARLPIPGEGFHAIPLYDEVPYVVVPKGHALAEFDSLDLADLEGEARFDLDESLDPEAQVGVVATGAGVAVMPQSLARLHSRKDVVSRRLTGLEATTIALVWPVGRDSDDIDDFVGIVRGRTAASSRGVAPGPTAPDEKRRPTPSKRAEGTGSARAKRPVRGQRATSSRKRRRR